MSVNTCNSSSKKHNNSVKWGKQSTESWKKKQLKHIPLAKQNNSGITSTLVYTVEGQCYQQTAQMLRITGFLTQLQKMSRVLSIQGYNGLQGVKQTIEIKDGKIVQRSKLISPVAEMIAGQKNLKNILVSAIVWFLKLKKKHWKKWGFANNL